MSVARSFGADLPPLHRNLAYVYLLCCRMALMFCCHSIAPRTFEGGISDIFGDHFSILVYRQAQIGFLLLLWWPVP